MEANDTTKLLLNALERIARLYEDVFTKASAEQLAGRLHEARCIARVAIEKATE